MTGATAELGVGMVRLNALGQSAIEIGEVRLCPEQPYLFAIALYLIVERGKKIPRNALVELMWPNDKDEKHARQRFRQNLLRLREVGLPVTGENGTLLLARNAAQADFETITSPDAILPGQSLEFLPHYAPKMSERFLDWVDTHRSRVHANVQRVFLVRMQQARSRGDWGEVESLAAECLKLDPYNEEAVMAQAECAVMRGSKREALGILDTYMEGLGSHVGTIGLPAKILRTRIAERLTDQRYAMLSEQHFVGRESSMEFLLNLLREAQRGSGSAVFIWGEPGIGKSRLVQEVTQIATLDGAMVVSTKCHPTDAGRPLSAFADLVPKLKTLPGALGCSAQTFSLLQRLTDRDRNDTYPAQEPGDAAFLAASIRRAVFDLVDAVADEGILLVVIEDVHWLDEPSRAILNAMVEWSTTRTLLILMTSRNAHATGSKTLDPDRGFHRHHLLPLAESDSGFLLDRLTAEDTNPLPPEARAWSVAAAEGNPYYLRELVRHWVETQESFGVPRSLAELIEARLNRLSSLALRVLQMCAALGRHSSFERLEKATGHPNHVLLDAVEELSNAVMLANSASGVAPKHDILATTALDRLGSTALRLVHRQVATILEAEINEKHNPALTWDCAEHWQQAGDSARALAAVGLCANHLRSVGHYRDAIDLYEKALPICASTDQLSEVLLALAQCLQAAAAWSRLNEVITIARTVVTNSNLAQHNERLQLLQLEADWRLRARPDHSHVQELVSFAKDATKTSTLRLHAAQLGMIQCSEEGRDEDAHVLMSAVDALGPAAQGASAAHTRMIYHADFGNLDTAIAIAEDVLTLAAQSGAPDFEARVKSNVALLYRRAGRAEEARSLLVGKVELALAYNLHAHAAAAMCWLATFAVQEEDFAMAKEWSAQASAYEPHLDEKGMADGLVYIRARIDLANGDVAVAREYLSRFEKRRARPANYRLRQTLAALKFDIDLRTGRQLDRASLDIMAGEFEKHCHLGQHDYFALILFRSFTSVGEISRAQAGLRTYLEDRRRDRGPLPPSLAAAAATLIS